MNVRRRLVCEDGVAMPVAVGVLLVVTTLAAATATAALDSSRSANTDRNSKRALAAANAGLEMAAYRLNTTLPHPTPSQCLTTVAAPPPASDPYHCAPVTESIGNGESYTYQVSVEKAAGVGCGGYAVSASAAGGHVRCITSIGTVGGVQRRVQTRVLALPTNPPYMPVHGVFGLDAVTIKNNADALTSSVGSNGAIQIGNNSNVGTIETGPAPPATVTTGSNYTQTNPWVPKSTAFTLQAVPVGTTATVNNNAALSGYAGYTSSTRDLDVTNHLVLPAGDYNFCRVTLANQNTSSIEPAPGATIRIFIDAPDDVRPGSGCPQTAGQGWGELHGLNGVTLGRFDAAGQPLGAAQDTQVFIVGWDPNPAALPGSKYGWNTIDVAKNNLQANALIYAPWSDVTVGKNNAVVWGGVAAKKVYVKNNLTFSWDSSLDNTGANSGDYTRQAWAECRSQPVSADPESGC